MVDVTPLVVKALRETGLKVYDENFTTSTTVVPCLSYLLITNKINKQGDTQEHSDVFYYIKVYAKRNSEIANYSNYDNFLKEMYKHDHFLDIQSVEIVPYKKNKRVLLINFKVKLYAQK